PLDALADRACLEHADRFLARRALVLPGLLEDLPRALGGLVLGLQRRVDLGHRAVLLLERHAVERFAHARVVVVARAVGNLAREAPSLLCLVEDLLETRSAVALAVVDDFRALEFFQPFLAHWLRLDVRRGLDHRLR